jgi:enoyl-CoA hydratase/carnithine racemase
MFVIDWEKDDDVAVIIMNNGENLQNSDFVRGMSRILKEIEEDDSVISVVISSGDPKSWCQGVDLEFLMERMAENDIDTVFNLLTGINKIFKRLLIFPVPVIAAIGGHAVGNGAVFACACDFRFMREDRGYFFFPDADLGIPTLPGSMEICKKAIPFPHYQEMLLSGKMLTARELYENRVILKASENLEKLMTDAIGFAKTMNKHRAVYSEIKMQLYWHIIDAIDKEDPAYIKAFKLLMSKFYP